MSAEGGLHSIRVRGPQRSVGQGSDPAAVPGSGEAVRSMLPSCESSPDLHAVSCPRRSAAKLVLLPRRERSWPCKLQGRCCYSRHRAPGHQRGVQPIWWTSTRSGRPTGSKHALQPDQDSRSALESREITYACCQVRHCCPAPRQRQAACRQPQAATCTTFAFQHSSLDVCGQLSTT